LPCAVGVMLCDPSTSGALDRAYIYRILV
jgi:hypothetical protein